MAGLGVEVSIKGDLLVVVGFDVSALGAVAGRVGDLDEAPAVEHKACPPAVGDEPSGRSQEAKALHLFLVAPGRIGRKKIEQ